MMVTGCHVSIIIRYGVNVDTTNRWLDCPRDWSAKNYSDIQKLHAKEWYVRKGFCESFGLSKTKYEYEEYPMPDEKDEIPF